LPTQRALRYLSPLVEEKLPQGEPVQIFILMPNRKSLNARSMHFRRQRHYAIVEAVDVFRMGVACAEIRRVGTTVCLGCLIRDPEIGGR
jgi:hypothetical protein